MELPEEQLTSELNDAKTRADQLTAQVKNLQSQQVQLQSSIDTDSAKRATAEFLN